MTKGSSRFSKLCSTASSNCIEQKILIEPETQIIIVEDEHTQTIQQSTDNNCLQRSDNLVTKLFKSTLKSKFFNQKNKKLENSEDSASEEEMLPNHLSSVNSTALAVAIPIEEPQADLKSTLNDGFKLKGILKKTRKDYSYVDQIQQSCDNPDDFYNDQSYFEKCQTTNSNQNSHDSMSRNNYFDNICSTSNTSASSKSVKFNDMIFKVKYTTAKSMSGIARLSFDKRNRFTMFQNNASLNSDYRSEKEIDPFDNSIDLLRFQSINFYESGATS